MTEFIANRGVPIGIWESESIVKYGQYSMILKFAAETAFNDFLYCVELKDKYESCKNHELQFWIYARNLLFVGESMAVVEAVSRGTEGPITTKIIDLEHMHIANLGKWYNVVRATEPKLILNTSYDHDKIEVDFEKLSWEKL